MAQRKRGRLTRRAALASGAVLLGGGAVFAFDSTPPGPAVRVAADPKTLRRGNGAEPDTLDPHKASGNWENNIIGDMFMGLMTEDAAANPVPGAATSYSASADGLTYTFAIRDHKWSDGVPVTAHDFVYAFRRMANPKTAAQYVAILYPVRGMQQAAEGKIAPEQIGVRALDARTLEIAFCFQVPYIAQLLTHYTTFPVPAHVIDKYGDAWLHPDHVATNGPYTLQKWSPNDYVRLARNPHFYDKDKVAIESVVFYPTQDSSAAVKRLRSGEFDLVTDSIPPQQVGWLKRYMAPELHLAPYILSQYVQFNFTRKPFDDVRVRTALSLAIDREIMCAKVTRAGETPAYSFVPPSMPGYRPKAMLRFKSMPMPARIEKARALLAQAGFGPQNRLAFDYNIQNTTETKLVAVALQQMWREVGADARLTPSDSQIHYDLLRKHDFAVAWAGWIADYRDPKNYLMLLQTSTTDLNYGVYSNPQFDALIDRSDNSRDPAARADLLGGGEQIVLDDMAVAPVFFGVTRNLVSRQVRNWISNNVNINRTRYLSLDRSVAAA